MNQNGPPQTSEDHVNTPWLERTVMNELTSMRGEIENMAKTLIVLKDAQLAQHDAAKRVLEALTFVLTKIDSLAASASATAKRKRKPPRRKVR